MDHSLIAQLVKIHFDMKCHYCITDYAHRALLVKKWHFFCIQITQSMTRIKCYSFFDLSNVCVHSVHVPQS